MIALFKPLNAEMSEIRQPLDILSEPINSFLLKPFWVCVSCNQNSASTASKNLFYPLHHKVLNLGSTSDSPGKILNPNAQATPQINYKSQEGGGNPVISIFKVPQVVPVVAKVENHGPREQMSLGDLWY